jgi:gliding motility-associated-like protein
MKDLEKLVKESFDDFQPEVRPEVWQRLEHGLNSAASSTGSAPQNPAGIVKGLAIKGGIWTWITGAAVTAGITAAILFSAEKNNVPVNNNHADTAHGVTAPVHIKEANTPAPVIELSVSHVSAEQKSVFKKPVSPSQEKTENIVSSGNENVKRENPEQEKVVTGNKNADDNQSDVQSTASEKPVLSNRKNDAEINKEEEAHSSGAGIPPAIIVSGTCGFAPFKVTALLNNEKLNGAWDFGDGHATASSNSASNTYNKPGTYELQCTLNNTGLKSTIQVLGTVGTAFTPNGDGQNDEFFIDAPLVELRVRIYNRAGHQEFEITHPGEHWDGKNQNGVDLPQGTYFYDIFARSVDGQVINQKGTINIFR